MANFKVNDALRIEEQLRAIADAVGAPPADPAPKFKVQDTKKIWEQINRISLAAGGFALGYVRYSIILSQSGTNAPVPIILADEFPGTTPVWTRTGVGAYLLTFPFNLDLNKLWIPGQVKEGGLLEMNGFSFPNALVFQSFDLTDLANPDDDIIARMPLELRLYP